MRRLTRPRAGEHRSRPALPAAHCLLLESVPFAGVLAVIVLVLGIAQVQALLVTLPAIAYIWTVGDYSTSEATIYAILLFVSGMAGTCSSR